MLQSVTALKVVHAGGPELFIQEKPADTSSDLRRKYSCCTVKIEFARLKTALIKLAKMVTLPKENKGQNFHKYLYKSNP